jgi:predicted Holliday junction resolvase-like endonuclease
MSLLDAKTSFLSPIERSKQALIGKTAAMLRFMQNAKQRHTVKEYEELDTLFCNLQEELEQKIEDLIDEGAAKLSAVRRG